jgi:hypothetical protein
VDEPTIDREIDVTDPNTQDVPRTAKLRFLDDERVRGSA